MAELKFDKPTHFDARGRNGYLAAYGVALFDMGSGDFAEIHLHPITARGKVSEACRTPIAKSAVPALIAELLQFMSRIEQLQLATSIIEEK
jgi:hypothetical protein